MDLVEAMNDGALFALWFGAPSWDPWKVFLRGLFALPMSSEDLHLFEQCTGRKDAPTAPAREGWAICGRRSGKSHTMALVAVYLSCFLDHTASLSTGQTLTVLLLASDRRQARTLHRYIANLLENVDLLAPMVEQIKSDSVTLTNGIVIEISAASFRSVRGYSLLACIADELAFWRSDESANPDREIINAVRPGLMSVRGSLLLAISSPYSQRGLLWDMFKKHWAQAGSMLVWRAATSTMNPTVDRELIEEAYEADPARAAAEFGAQFRSDLQGLVDQAVVESVVVHGRHELPWLPNTSYFSFCDPSGGSSDSFSLAVAHRENDLVILDLIRERRPPFNADQVVEEFANTLKAYGISEIQGDRYGGQWVGERFAVHGINYWPCERSKSELYLAALPMLNSGRVELLDSPRLVAQLCGLERRTSRAGRDTVDHSVGSHDDVANCVCGVLTSSRAPVDYDQSMYELDDDELTDFSQAALSTDDYIGTFQ